MSLADAKRFLAAEPAWPKKLRGDLQMHTCWSDGSGTIAQMAEAATERSYEYIGITDHSKGLRIAGGMDEQTLKKTTNRDRETQCVNFKIGLQPNRPLFYRDEPKPKPVQGDMSSKSLLPLDLVLGAFHSSLHEQQNQVRTRCLLRRSAIQIFKF